jgi:hypothetical protein
MKGLAEVIHNIELKMMRRLFIILLIFSGFCSVQSQSTTNMTRPVNDCHALMKEADKLFQEGIYDKCINDLEGVLKTCELTRTEREHVMELLAKAYIETGDSGKADATVNQMLIKFPHYELKEADNSEEYNRLVKKYTVHPQLSIGIRNTAKWINFKSTKVFSVLDGLDYSAPYVHQGFGFMYYGWGEIQFDKDISLNGDLIFVWTNYDRKINKAPGFNLEFWENDKYTQIPVYVKKYFHIGENVLPYITAGMGWLWMTQALGNSTISYTKDDLITGKNADYSAAVYNVNMLGMRNVNTFEWLAGAGIGYKIKNLRLFLDARYYGGLNSFTNPSKRSANSSLTNDFYYVDNSVKLNQFEIGASVSYTLINSVKRVKR